MKKEKGRRFQMVITIELQNSGICLCLSKGEADFKLIYRLR